jgi:hypothetical protein
VFSQFGKVLDIVSLKTFRLRGQVSVTTLSVALLVVHSTKEPAVSHTQNERPETETGAGGRHGWCSRG